MSSTKKPENQADAPQKPHQQTLGGVMAADLPPATWDDATDIAQTPARPIPGYPTPPSAVPRPTSSTQARMQPMPGEPRATAPTMAASSGGPRPATGPNKQVTAPMAAAPVPEIGKGDPYIDSIVAERYRVIKKLGEGGMGVVYLAEHILIEKKVALKILSEDFARKADLVQRFMQEAKAAAKIGHENIVEITDFGETPSGSVFIAMEFLDGADVASHIRKSGPMPFERTRHIVTQICRALGAAHAKGIIHRDMKPENVYLIEREGQPDFAKVLDFGIAKMNSMEEGGSRLTRTGMIFGTPEYMSPEQARGDRPDHRVDIYAVGCILYEMLTGDVPFHADTFMGVLTKHMFEPPVPPSQRAPQMGIAPDVEAVVMRALAKDRDQRFQTMKDMSVALAACGGLDAAEGWGNEPSLVMHREDSVAVRTRAPGVTSVPGGPQLEIVDPPKKGRLALVGLLVAVLAAGGAAGMVVILRKPPPKPIDPVIETPVKPVVEAPLKPAAPARPSSYRMTFKSSPSGADVMRGSELLGTTPASIEFDTSDKPLTVVVRKKQYKDYSIDVTADRERNFEFDLVPVKSGGKSHSGGKSGKLPSLPTPPPVATPVVKPATPPPATKPSGKLRDLKDPFSQSQ